jgi:HEAT repeat protein
MTVVFVILAVVLVIGIAVGVYAWFAPRVQQAAQPPPAPREPLQASTDWTTQAGAEFSGLAESARCDLIFAVSDLNDERSQQLLLHALNDPSDAVALAAAHALARRGAADAVDEYVAQHPGDRAKRMVETLALLQ